MSTGILSRSFNKGSSSQGDSRTTSTTSENNLDDECPSSHRLHQDHKHHQIHYPLQRLQRQEAHNFHPPLNQTYSTPTQSSSQPPVDCSSKSKSSLAGLSSIIFRTSSSPIPRRSPVSPSFEARKNSPSQVTSTVILAPRGQDTDKNTNCVQPESSSGVFSSFNATSFSPLKKSLINLCHPLSPATVRTSTSGSSDSKEDSPKLPPSPVLRTLSKVSEPEKIESLFKRTGSRGSQKKPLKKSSGLLLDTSSSEEEEEYDDIDTTGRSFQRKKSSSTDDSTRSTPSPRTPNSFKILKGIDRNQATAFDFPPSPYYSTTFSRPASYESRYSERQSSDDTNTHTSSFRSRSTSSEVFEGDNSQVIIPSLAPIHSLVRNRRTTITPLKKQQAIAEESKGFSSRVTSGSTASSNIFISVSTADESLVRKEGDSNDTIIPLKGSPVRSASPILGDGIYSVVGSHSRGGSLRGTHTAVGSNSRGGSLRGTHSAVGSNSRSGSLRGTHSRVSNGSSASSTNANCFVVTDQITQQYNQHNQHHQTLSYSSTPSQETVISHSSVTSSISGSKEASWERQEGEEDPLVTLENAANLFRKVTIKKRVAPIPSLRSASAEPTSEVLTSFSRPSSSEPQHSTIPILMSPSHRNLPFEISQAFNLRSS